MQQILQATVCDIRVVLKWRSLFYILCLRLSGLCSGLSKWDELDGNSSARNQFCIISSDMRHFIRSHERNRRHSLKTAEEHRRNSMTNSYDNQLLRKSSLPASAFANDSTSPKVNGAAKRFRRFNTISDDINPVTLSLVVCTMAFFIVAALLYSLFCRK